MQIDRIGTFLVGEIDRALGQTKKQGLPQLAIKVKVLQYYDQANEEYLDYSEYDMQTDAYFTLAFNGKDGMETTFSFDDIMRVYNWDGRDFQTLTELPAPETFMIKVKDNDPEFAAKNPFVVSKIDTADANPSDGLRKLDAAGVQSLQAQYGALLNKKGKVAPPASAKKAPPVAPTTTPPKAAAPTPAPVVEDEPAPPKQTPAEKKAAKKAKSEKVAADNARLEAEKVEKTTKAPPVPPTASIPAPAPTEDTKEEVTGSKTKQEAYEYVYEMQAAGITDEQRNNAWNAAILQIAGDVDQQTITGEQWYQIMHETLNDVGAV